MGASASLVSVPKDLCSRKRARERLLISFYNNSVGQEDATETLRHAFQEADKASTHV